MSGTGYLVSAYVATIGLYGLYAWRLVARARRAERDLGRDPR